MLEDEEGSATTPEHAGKSKSWRSRDHSPPVSVSWCRPRSRPTLNIRASPADTPGFTVPAEPFDGGYICITESVTSTATTPPQEWPSAGTPDSMWRPHVSAAFYRDNSTDSATARIRNNRKPTTMTAALLSFSGTDQVSFTG